MAVNKNYLSKRREFEKLGGESMVDKCRKNKTEHIHQALFNLRHDIIQMELEMSSADIIESLRTM